MRRPRFLAWAWPVRQPPPLPSSLLERASRLLTDLIQTARGTAIAAGVKSMPPRIHSAMLGFFPDAILRRVRYASGPVETISIPGLARTYGDDNAVTLGDVILFRDDQAARADHALWARELTHVMQFERWGIEGFASRYLEDKAALEREARDNASRYVNWSEHART